MDQINAKIYSKRGSMNRLKTAILTELPGPCNFNKCEYCYVNPKDPRRRDEKNIKVQDYLRLIDRLPDRKNRQILLWFCGVGEPTMHRSFKDLVIQLTDTYNYPVMINTNLVSRGASVLLDIKPSNTGIWFSIHWDELKKKDRLDIAKYRLSALLDRGVSVFPMMLLYPSYVSQIDEIIEVMKPFGLKIKMMQYRDFKISRLENGLVEPHERVMKKLRENPMLDWSHYDNASKRWSVKGGKCSSGADFVVIDSRWQVRSCGGAGHIDFGQFPEDVEKMKFRERGICIANECPCSWVLFHGINSKFSMKLSGIFDVEMEGKLKEFFS